MQNLKPLASLYSWAGQFESYLVANPEDRSSHDERGSIIITYDRSVYFLSEYGLIYEFLSYV